MGTCHLPQPITLTFTADITYKLEALDKFFTKVLTPTGSNPDLLWFQRILRQLLQTSYRQLIPAPPLCQQTANKQTANHSNVEFQSSHQEPQASSPKYPLSANPKPPKMICTNLSIAAAILREEIKQMIPETDTRSLSNIPENQQPRVVEDKNGNRSYSGDLLTTKCMQLLRAMGVGGNVRICLDAFSKNRGLIQIGLGIPCGAFSEQYRG